MKILNTIKKIKNNLKQWSKEFVGKSILSITALGLVLSFISLQTLSSIHVGFAILYIFAFALSPISLIVGFVGLDKLRSKDEEDNYDFLLTSAKMLGFGFFTMIINLLSFNDSMLTYISTLFLFAGIYGIQLFTDKNFDKEIDKMNKIRENEDNNQIKKLPLRLNLKEEEQELGLTNYFKK